MEELCAGIKFMNKEHKDFFCRNLLKCRELDIYHMALIYCLGIDRTVREHFEKVYDLKNGEIQTEVLQEGWQTSGSKRAIRLAFNLYTNGIAAGLGLEYSHPKAGHFQIEGRYYYGLGNIYGDSKKDYFGKSNFGNIVVKLTYLFDLTK